MRVFAAGGTGVIGCSLIPGATSEAFVRADR